MRIAEKICIPEFSAVSTCITLNALLPKYWDSVRLQTLPYPSDLGVHFVKPVNPVHFSCMDGAQSVKTADSLSRPPYSLTRLTALKMSVPLVMSCNDRNFNNSSHTSNEPSIALLNMSSWLTSVTSEL